MPFCPKCRDEFQDWVKTCPDCGIALVDILPVPPEPEKPEPSLPDDPIVTIATFTYPTEAHLARTKLESEGIDSLVAGEHISQVNWFYSMAGGGVRLQVKASDANRASLVLKGTTDFVPEVNPVPETDNDERCPKCSSYNIQYQTFSNRGVFLLWFLTSLLIGGFSPTAGGFSLPLLKRKWKCHNCGYEWKAPKP